VLFSKDGKRNANKKSSFLSWCLPPCPPKTATPLIAFFLTNLFITSKERNRLRLGFQRNGTVASKEKVIKEKAFQKRCKFLYSFGFFFKYRKSYSSNSLFRGGFTILCFLMISPFSFIDFSFLVYSFSY